MGKLLFLVCMLVVGGYIYHNVASFDPTVFAYSKEQAQDILVDAKTTLPRRDGGGQIQIWGAGRSEKGVTLNMQYASRAPLLTCEAVITAIAPNQSRVVTDCSSGPESGSTMSRTQDELRAPMFEEHIQATLNKRKFDREMVDRREAAVVFRNLGGLQNEALQRAAEFKRMETEFRR